MPIIKRGITPTPSIASGASETPKKTVQIDKAALPEPSEKGNEIICTICPCCGGEVCEADLDKHFRDFHVSTSDADGTDQKLSTKLTPFFLKHVYGVNVNVPVFNLTKNGEELIFYSATHAGVLYNYGAGVTRLLQGHQNVICSISASNTAQYIVTADGGAENLMVVWNCEDCLPVFTIYNPYPKLGIAIVGMSPSGKYILSVSHGDDPTIDLRFWTRGRDLPDFSHQLMNPGEAKAISFHPNKEELVMVAFQKSVAFLAIDPHKYTASVCIPDIHKMVTRTGLLTDCTFIEDCHECVACSEGGCFMVFGNTIYSQPFHESPLLETKNLIKAMKVSESRINCITTVDSMIVTGDSLGRVKFYDNRFKLLYWCQDFTLPGIRSISFDLGKREYELRKPTESSTDSEEDEHSEFKDKSKEYEIIYTNMVPSDCTLQRNPFVTRNFVASTDDGNVYRIDFIKNECTGLLFATDEGVAAIDAHYEKQYLCMGYASGRITLHNYETMEKMFEYILPQPTDKQEEVAVTCLKYSPQSLHLAVGRSNGEIWMLDQMDIHPKSNFPLKASSYSIQKICFSSNSLLMASYDVERTVCLFSFRPWLNDWMFLGKTRFHYKPITDMMFTSFVPARLFTIAEDRMLVEYDTNSVPIELNVLKSERIEQTAIPQAFLCYPSTNPHDPRYILVANSELKYKKINMDTFKCASVCLGPSYKCFENSPVKKMMIIPQCENKYILFLTNKHIGVQLLPPDGNPYKYNGIIAHPRKLYGFTVSLDGKWIFTHGEQTRVVMLWQINPQSVEHLAKFSGEGLNPYYSLIEGGRDGWMFKEIQDLFYYMQILHQGENSMHPREVNDYIPISELPDLMRACGCYLTEAEMEILVAEISYRDFYETGVLRTRVSFSEFVLLWINHRPARGVKASSLKEAFKVMVRRTDGIDCVDKDEMASLLTSVGEPFTEEALIKCMMTLTRQEPMTNLGYEVEDRLWFLPTDITFEYFVDEILGIDLEKLGAGKVGLSSSYLVDTTNLSDETHESIA